MFDDLYQEIILTHSRHPRNRGELGPEAKHVHLNNPLCGDEVSMFIEFKDGVVKDVKCGGQGCAISQASSSIISELIKGKGLTELKALTKDFHDMMQGNPSPEFEERWGDLIALEGVKKFPARVRCAMLACEAVERIVSDLEASA